MNKPKYSIVLADADETIFDFKKAEFTAFKATLNYFGKDCTDQEVEVYSEINLNLWKELEKGIITREKLKHERFDRWFEYMGFDIDSKVFDKLYVENLGNCGFLIDGAFEFIEKLSTVCDIYIVTNGLTKSQTSRFNNSAIKPYIKKLYISEEIGYAKPSIEYFDYCINDIGESDRSKYIILGDSLSSDMQGGRNAKIATCRYIRDGVYSPSPLCDYVITDYNQFFDVLGI